MPLDKAAQRLVVGNNTGDIDAQFAAAPAMQQVVEAVIVLADQQHNALPESGIADLPGHPELFRQSGEARAQFCRIERQRIGADFLAHEKLLRFQIGVVTGFYDPPAMLRDEAAHRRDDADSIRTGDGQGVSVGGSHDVRPRMCCADFNG